MPDHTLNPEVLAALSGAPDETELLGLARQLAQAYHMDDDHEVRHEQIRAQLLDAHERLLRAEQAAVLETPLGWIGLVWGERGLRRLTLPLPDRAAVLALLGEQHPRCSLGEPPAELAEWLRGYCAGERVLPPAVDFSNMSIFRRRVLELVANIPYGETRSYRWVGDQLGVRNYQAVGQALGANPIPIMIPCHRVVASDGSLRGYAGGLELKRRLLELEGWRG